MVVAIYLPRIFLVRYERTNEKRHMLGCHHDNSFVAVTELVIGTGFENSELLRGLVNHRSCFFVLPHDHRFQAFWTASVLILFHFVTNWSRSRQLFQKLWNNFLFGFIGARPAKRLKKTILVLSKAHIDNFRISDVLVELTIFTFINGCK